MNQGDYKFNWALSEIRKGTPIIDMYAQGLTPDQVKVEIIKLLDPYFEDKAVLEEFALKALISEAVLVARWSADDWVLEMLEKCLLLRRQAKASSFQGSLEAAVAWMPATMQGLSVHWRQYHLERAKDSLELDELLHECLQNIGSIIEGSAKPYLMELLHQVRISRGENVSLASISSLTLGAVIDELIRKVPFSELFAPLPWNIRLNQWRNIAQHLSAEVQGDLVVCRYGNPPNLHEIKLTRAELIEVTTTLYLVYSVLKTSKALFFVDNIRLIESLGILPTNIELKPEMQVLNFSLAVASQGFELIDFQWKPEEARAVVQDVTDMDSSKRRFHTTQFPVLLWWHTKSDTNVIEYREKDGTPSFLSSVGMQNCERLERGEITTEQIANLVEMIDLKTGTVIPPMPED